MLFTKAEQTDERKAFYERIDKHSLTPLWEALANLVPPHPAPACVPTFWRYREMRPYLMEAGRLISAREAERRVLVLEHPGLRRASSAGIATGDASGGRRTRALRRQPAAARACPKLAHDADLQLSLCTHPRSAGADPSRRSAAPGARLQDAIRESGHGGLPD